MLHHTVCVIEKYVIVIATTFRYFDLGYKILLANVNVSEGLWLVISKLKEAEEQVLKRYNQIQ